MAAMIGHINENQRKHIVTIEDPIEYVHDNKKSIVRQREIGRDTQSFTRGLRAALRQDPDVIAIGEMRDYDTIKTALAAAETGVLVLSTLHIISIDKIIERLQSFLDRRYRVETVHRVNIDVIGLQPPETRFDRPRQMIAG